VLAGHSFGGLYNRTYAAKYPEEIAGLVLVDSTSANDEPASQPDAGSYSAVEHVSALVGATAPLGLGRLLAKTSFSDLPPEYRDDYRAATATAKSMSGTINEYFVASRSAAEARSLRSLGRKPLIVLTAERGSRKGWMADQNKMLTLSTNNIHRVVPGATHASFVEHPDHAAAVARAIHDVVGSVRTGEPLKGS